MKIETGEEIANRASSPDSDFTSGRNPEKDKRYVATDEVHKELDIFMVDLIALERELPISTSKKITALCIKLSDRFVSTTRKVQK